MNDKVSDSVAARSEMKNQLAVQNTQKKNKTLIWDTMVLILVFYTQSFQAASMNKKMFTLN